MGLKGGGINGKPERFSRGGVSEAVVDEEALQARNHNALLAKETVEGRPISIMAAEGEQGLDEGMATKRSEKPNDQGVHAQEGAHLVKGSTILSQQC